MKHYPETEKKSEFEMRDYLLHYKVWKVNSVFQCFLWQHSLQSPFSIKWDPCFHSQTHRTRQFHQKELQKKFLFNFLPPWAWCTTQMSCLWKIKTSKCLIYTCKQKSHQYTTNNFTYQAHIHFYKAFMLFKILFAPVHFPFEETVPAYFLTRMFRSSRTSINTCWTVNNSKLWGHFQ